MDRATLVSRLLARREVLSKKPRPRTLRGQCWIWTGGRQSGDDYGKVSVDGVMRYTHRVSAHLWLGMKIDSPLVVRHRCIGNPACFQPLHLRVGTIAQNNGDIVAQGRHVPGGAMDGSAVANLIGCVRSGKVSIGKWASLNRVAYCTAYRAYHGISHAAAAAIAHNRWDAKQGNSSNNPILNPPVVTVDATAPGTAMDLFGGIILVDDSEVAADVALHESEYRDSIPF